MEQGTESKSLSNSDKIGGWPRSYSSSTTAGAPHLAFEMWASAALHSLRIALHQDSISTVPA